MPSYVGTIVPSLASVNDEAPSMADAPKMEPLTLEQALGQILFGLRTKRKLKQVEVSVATNFAVTTIRKMEKGRLSMTIRSLDALAMYYGLSIDQLLRRAVRLRAQSSK